MSRIIEMIGNVGSQTNQNIRDWGYAGRFISRLFGNIGIIWKLPREFTKQLYFLGNRSLLIIVVSGFFIGAVLGLQGYNALVTFGAEQALGLLAVKSLTRELGPVITALLYAGRAGTAMTAEIGLMKASEQLIALQMMAVDPIRRILTPRFYAGMLAVPLLTMICIAIGVVGAYMVGVHGLGVDSGAFWSQIQAGVSVDNDVMSGVIKSIVFGIGVTFIALYQGYEAKSTPEGVALATTKTVVQSSLMVLVLDFLLTAIMFSN